MTRSTSLSTTLCLLVLSSFRTYYTRVAAELPELSEDINYGAWSELGRGIGAENLGDEAGYSVASSAEGTIVAVGAPAHNMAHIVARFV